VLAHGWEGHGSQLGAFVDPLVAHGFSVVTFDAPAHGVSPGAQATLRDFADALSTVSDRVGSPAAIIGHSFGALAALMAVKDGLSTPALAMIAAPSPKAYVEHFASALELSPHVAAEMRGRFEHKVGRSFDEVEGVALASGVTVPSLVVHDRNDKEVPWQLSERLAHSWPSARFELTERLGHRRILKDEGVVAKVTEFVAAHPPRTG
jgi:pimeloyl-ACP methyl ester carboxylesterase